MSINRKLELKCDCCHATFVAPKDVRNSEESVRNYAKTLGWGHDHNETDGAGDFCWKCHPKGHPKKMHLKDTTEDEPKLSYTTTACKNGHHGYVSEQYGLCLICCIENLQKQCVELEKSTQELEATARDCLDKIQNVRNESVRLFRRDKWMHYVIAVIGLFVILENLFGIIR